MKFSDVLKKSFLQQFASVDTSLTNIMMVLGLTLVIGLYIFFCYRFFTRRSFYSKNFNIALVALALITSGIILTIQSSVVVSLGMVGALSIVRFRTAVKDPMDLMFLFWSISAGIICGAGLAEIAIVLSIVVTIALFVLDRLPIGKAPMILVLNGEYSTAIESEITERIKLHSRSYEVKTRNVTDGHVQYIIELRTNESAQIVEAMQECPGVTSVSLLSHNGEVTF